MTFEELVGLYIVNVELYIVMISTIDFFAVQVAHHAIACLQRALMVLGLSSMGGGGWEACFHSVLFPLLEQLPRRADITARVNTNMCKVMSSL